MIERRKGSSKLRASDFFRHFLVMARLIFKTYFFRDSLLVR